MTNLSDGGTGAEPGSPADKQVLVRVTEETREEWKSAAEALSISLSELVRSSVQKRVDETLYCQHPMQFRKVYPWSESCLKCGVRLRAEDRLR